MACLGTLGHSIQTGQSAFEHLYGMTGFTYLTEHPEAGAIFDAAMTSRSADENQAVLSAFDFARFTTLADIGGGHGSLLTAILERYPSLQGLLFDLPHVVAGAVDDLSEQVTPSAVRSWVVTSSRQSPLELTPIC